MKAADWEGDNPGHCGQVPIGGSQLQILMLFSHHGSPMEEKETNICWALDTKPSYEKSCIVGKIYIPTFTTYANLSRASKKLICLFLNFPVVPAGTKSKIKSLNLYFVMMQPQLDPIVRSVKSKASSSVIWHPPSAVAGRSNLNPNLFDCFIHQIYRVPT